MKRSFGDVHIYIPPPAAKSYILMSWKQNHGAFAVDDDDDDDDDP